VEPRNKEINGNFN